MTAAANPTDATEIEEQPPGNVWKELRAALRGVQHDYTSGPVGRALLLLAVPMVLETVAESIFAVVDVFFVSKLGAWAAATVGITETLMHLVYTVALGLSIGVTAMVARRVGEKDPEAAARAAVQAICLGVAIAAVIGVLGGIFAPQLLALMGADEAVVAQGAPFIRIMLAGNVTVMLLFLINAAFRGAGDAAIAMRVLWLANGINVILDPALIFGWGPLPELGIQGAAIATNIGRGTAVLAQFWWLARAGGRLSIGRRHLEVIPSMMWRLWRLSATAMFQILVPVASWIGLVRILAGFGAEALAGYTIGIRLVIFALFPSWGMSNAAATMVGQSLGAGKPERAEHAVWTAAYYNMLGLGFVGAVYWVFAPTLVTFFASVDDPRRAAEVANVIGWGASCLRIVSTGFVFYAYAMVLEQSFNGAGDVWTPTYINIVCFWLFELPLAAVLAHGLGWGPHGVFVAMTLSFSLLALVSGVIFKRGRWKEKMV
jgi:putative MATE family efflux protein